MVCVYFSLFGLVLGYLLAHNNRPPREMLRPDRFFKEMMLDLKRARRRNMAAKKKVHIIDSNDLIKEEPIDE